MFNASPFILSPLLVSKAEILGEQWKGEDDD